MKPLNPQPSQSPAGNIEQDKLNAAMDQLLAGGAETPELKPAPHALPNVPSTQPVTPVMQFSTPPGKTSTEAQDYRQDQDRVRGIQRQEPAPLFGPEETEQLATLPRKEVMVKIADKLEAAGEKAIALAEINERVMRRAQEITELKGALEQIRRERASVQTETIKAPETEIFTADFIKDQVKKLLESQEAVKKIYSLDVRGEKKKITLSIKVKAHKPDVPFTNTDVDAKATLQSRDGVILVTNYNIQATSFQEDVKSLFEKKLSMVSEMIKNEIEKIRKNKKIDKIEIINGELKVTYK